MAMNTSLAGLLAGAVMLALAGCGQHAATAQARAQVESTRPNAPSETMVAHQTMPIIGPYGQKIPCTSYGGGFCVQR
jgi:ABC-type glycerol-3-phosphate transport system substrate-binding protein